MSKTKELKKLLKRKQKELDDLLDATAGHTELWDASKVNRLINEAEILREQIANKGKQRVIPEVNIADPVLREIEKKLIEKYIPSLKLHCPECGASDNGNRMNGKPWCFKCNRVITTKTDKYGKVKVLRGKYPSNLTFKKLESV